MEHQPRLWTLVLHLNYYLGLISKGICVVDSLSSALNFSWLTWIDQRQNIIIIMVLTGQQFSLPWVEGNACSRDKRQKENVLINWVNQRPVVPLFPILSVPLTNFVFSEKIITSKEMKRRLCCFYNPHEVTSKIHQLRINGGRQNFISAELLILLQGMYKCVK